MPRSYAAADEWEPAPEGVESLPLFATPIREMARRDDPDTSKAAAIAVSDRLTELQARVLAAFQRHGRLTAKELEQLPEMEDLGFSTARKRCSELLSRGWLRKTGTVKDGCREYEVAR